MISHVNPCFPPSPIQTLLSLFLFQKRQHGGPSTSLCWERHRKPRNNGKTIERGAAQRQQMIPRPSESPQQQPTADRPGVSNLNRHKRERLRADATPADTPRPGAAPAGVGPSVTHSPAATGYKHGARDRRAAWWRALWQPEEARRRQSRVASRARGTAPFSGASGVTWRQQGWLSEGQVPVLRKAAQSLF